MSNYKKKSAKGQGAANKSAGYLIRNGRTMEECYLQRLQKDPNRENCAISIWTADETKAKYFGSKAEAQKLIDQTEILLHASAKVVRA